MVLLKGLVALFGLLSLVVAVVGLIAPTVFKNKKTGKVPTRWTLFMGGLGFMLLASAVVDYLTPKPQGFESVTTVETDAARSVDSMGLTVNEFHDAFNDAIGRYNEEFKTADFEVRTGGATDTFLHVFSQDLTMIGTLDKNDGNVDMVILNITPNEEELIQVRAVLLATTEALNPGISVDENKKMVLEVFHESIAKFDSKEQVERKVGNLKYSAMTTSHTGMMFSIVKSSKS